MTACWCCAAGLTLASFAARLPFALTFFAATTAMIAAVFPHFFAFLARVNFRHHRQIFVGGPLIAEFGVSACGWRQVVAIHFGQRAFFVREHRCWWRRRFRRCNHMHRRWRGSNRRCFGFGWLGFGRFDRHRLFRWLFRCGSGNAARWRAWRGLFRGLFVCRCRRFFCFRHRSAQIPCAVASRQARSRAQYCACPPPRARGHPRSKICPAAPRDVAWA